MSSTIFSRAGIQEVERWQFCSTTHPPASMLALISRSAITPCPCPRLTLSNVTPRALLKLLTATKGSAPGERMKRRGVWGAESGQILARSKGKDRVNCGPRQFSTSRLKPSIIFSGLRHLQSISLLTKPCTAQFSGSGYVKGCALVAMAWNSCFSFPPNSVRMLSKGAISANLQASPHMRSLTHLSRGFSTEILLAVTVLDSRKRSTSPRGRCSLSAMRAARRRRSFWKRLRLMLLKRVRRKWWRRLMRRASTLSLRSLWSMARAKRSVKQLREYWYMESTLARSLTAKNSTDPSSAMLTYSCRARSISFSVSSASFCFSPISVDFSLEADSTLMAFSSPRMLLELPRMFRISSSISFSARWLSADSTTSFSFSASRSGRSLLTRRARSWSVSPSSVIMKLIMTTWVQTSGRQCGLRSLVVMQRQKSLEQISTFSPIRRQVVAPFRQVCFSSTGLMAALISVPRFSMRTGVPNWMQFSRLRMKLSSVIFTTFSLRCASCRFSHRLHWPCGSTISGHRREFDIMIAFSTEKLSQGSPFIFHSRTFIGLPSTFASDACAGSILRAVLLNLSVHSSRMRWRKACVKGPRQLICAAAMKMVTSRVSSCFLYSSLRQCHRTFSSFRLMIMMEARFREISHSAYSRSSRSFFSSASSSYSRRFFTLLFASFSSPRFSSSLALRALTFSSARRRDSFLGLTFLLTKQKLQMPLTHWMMHQQARELLATFWTERTSLLAGSLRNLPRQPTTPSVSASLLKFTRSLSSLGLARLRTDAAHQSVSIFSVFSFFIFSLGAGSISRHSPCSVSLTAMGGLSMARSSVRLFLSSTRRAFSAALSLGRAMASSTSHSCLMELASVTASSTMRSSPEI